MFKKSILLTAIFSLFLSACSSSDQRYKREIEGSDDYLNAAELKPIIVPNGITLPAESSEFYIYDASSRGDIGKDIDIRPPSLPISALVDSYVSYENGVVTLDSPDYLNLWQVLPALLQKQRVTIEQRTSYSIKTANVILSNDDDSADAKYLIQHQLSGSRELTTLELTSLKKSGKDIVNMNETQRYTVEFFNKLMKQYALMYPTIDNTNESHSDK